MADQHQEMPQARAGGEHQRHPDDAQNDRRAQVGLQEDQHDRDRR